MLASSSVFPVFPMHKIGEETFLDGCYYDNLPIDLAIEMGASDVVAVDLHTTPQHPNYARRPYVTYITPSRDLGGILDFDHERILRNERMGYRDAMRHFGKYKGYRYCFYPESLAPFSDSIERLSLAMARGESILLRNGRNKLEKAGDIYRMFSLLEEPVHGKALSKEDYFIRSGEICAEMFALDDDPIYDMSEFASALKGKLMTPEAYPDAMIFSRASNRGIFKRLSDLKIANDSQYLTGCLYYALRGGEVKYEEQLGILSFLPHEMAAALFLSCL